MASNSIQADARVGRMDRNPPTTSSLQNPALRPQNPPPTQADNRGHRYTLVQRTQCLTLLAEGYSGKDIEEKTGISRSTHT
jgi:DNA-binding NarL/FixJ family response regulator